MVDACPAQFISNAQPAKDADSLLNQRLMVWDVSPYSTLCVCVGGERGDAKGGQLLMPTPES